MAARTVTKKLINTPESCVDDNLRGVAAMFPRLRLHPNHRVVTVQAKEDSGRVAVLGGGGSGHEPFASGFVAAGMLTGAVAGGVFASPPTGHVLYAIAELHKYNTGGVLVILGNYTGDRLNFGKAIEKAKAAGLKVEGLIVGEDVASSHNKTGGRSMCGEVFFYKLCGAMAAAGYSMPRMLDVAAEANRHMATLGVCLSACSLPGQPPLFEIAAGEMELGAGVHGEAGVRRLQLGTAAEVVQLILDQILAHLKLAGGERVAVMVDNLGGTSFMEMNILAAEVKSYLEQKTIAVVRMYVGHMKTSLEMHGFQICLLHLPPGAGGEWLRLLDHPTDAAGWAGSALSLPGDGQNVGDDEEVMRKFLSDEKLDAGPSLAPAASAALRAGLAAAAAALVAQEELLNRLDSGCGDGDCGNTMKKYGLAIQKYLRSAALGRPARALQELAAMAETDMGGTSGGIYSLGLAAAALALERQKRLDLAACVVVWESAMHAISKYGGAEPGDRTMLDTLHYAVTALKQNLNSDYKVALQRTADAAEAGARATATMDARAGRASYVSKAYATAEDAGARAAAVWLRAILDVFIQQA